MYLTNTKSVYDSTLAPWQPDIAGGPVDFKSTCPDWPVTFLKHNV